MLDATLFNDAVSNVINPRQGPMLQCGRERRFDR